MSVPDVLLKEKDDDDVLLPLGDNARTNEALTRDVLVSESDVLPTSTQQKKVIFSDSLLTKKPASILKKNTDLPCPR